MRGRSLGEPRWRHCCGDSGPTGNIATLVSAAISAASPILVTLESKHAARPFISLNLTGDRYMGDGHRNQEAV
jgi:hypothetical protein